ncbi:MAG TPA: glycoside hydrolase family 20 zincin-like fold domain-containing protein [Bryobacteraceae bacterium]|nr:glycoside hydrolase family 20 zincin-like fold domain-containing protein [Bryobacteraceae bacterium]
MRGRAAAIAALAVFPIKAMALDLTGATIVAPPNLKAVTVLVEEVEKRTGIRWPVERTAEGVRIEISEKSEAPAEGYHIEVRDGSVRVTGNDARGVLFGVGRLLRELRMGRGAVSIADGWRETSAPKYGLRGHQLGYRPKTNSYDGWSVPVWEQYIRDLAVFGTNAIELIPPRSDDDADSPHFPLPPMRMMTEMSHLADEYGLDVWIWYPAMDTDYTDPKTVNAALEEWGEVFRKLPRVDAVFVPGGDPGHTEPKVLMALLDKQTAVLHRYHPKAQMWVSPQGFNQAWLDEFYLILKSEPAWLSGVVYGPQIRDSLEQVRAAVPKRYPIRHYPDITHSRQCQYPVPDWDVAYSVTEGREVINPRPTGEAEIFRRTAPYTIGFITYSEGCNDDVNKFVWSALGWNPEAKVEDVLGQFGRYFVSERYGESFAQGLAELERDWKGPLAANTGVEGTLAHFQELEHSATPQMLADWRFQQGLYRAYYDAYTRRRLAYETDLERQAMNALEKAGEFGTERAMANAESILHRAVSDRVAVDLRARVFELAEALFQSIRMQLSVARYKAIAVDRGATLDTLDAPLNNRLWLEQRFRELRAAPTQSERLAGLHEILHWTDAGPGGFYDDLGDTARQPHLVRDESTLIGFGPAGTRRRSWWDNAESRYDTPLRMHYDGLDRAARYKIRVVYAGENPRRKIRLVAGEKWEVHGLMEKPTPLRPLEFDIPHEATEHGELDLAWYGEPGLGGNGRGCQVSEVWLIKK